MPTQMTLALINRHFWTDGAIPLTVRHVAKHVSRRGVNVVAFASDVRAEDSTESLRYVPVKFRRVKAFDLGGFVFAARLCHQLLAAHKRQPFDVMEVHDSTAFYGAWLFSRLRQVPVIMFMHACIFESGKRDMYPWSLALTYKINTRFYLKRAHCIACISQRLVEWAKKLGAPPERVRFIHEPVDTETFRPRVNGALSADCGNGWNGFPTSGNERNRFHPLPQSIDSYSPTLLYVGRLSPEKGAQVLIDALPQMLQRLPRLRLRLIGGGSQQPSLRDTVNQNGLKEHVEFVGAVPHHELPRHYAEADALVIPSLSEGLPKVLPEALACGLPIIGTQVGGIPEVVQNGYNGLLVPPGDPDALADAVVTLFSQHDLHHTLRANARPSVERFSWERNVGQFIQMYESVCQRIAVTD
ncbi:MAG: glycosyltransferase family 4 protein [Abditibacteriales bacterium]|nr:glycosyltransferase family 4 protein [Abditibacteriales bacterium]MDW8366967.1 glycosyltransferase family 4 protein [Abditibacteriales bacterium]